jgi:hypothetical protein
MSRPQAGLVDGQRAPVQRLCLAQLALGLQQILRASEAGTSAAALQRRPQGGWLGSGCFVAAPAISSV